jgi:DNA-binding transcriptional ArsR family regulator
VTALPLCPPLRPHRGHRVRSVQGQKATCRLLRFCIHLLLDDDREHERKRRAAARLRLDPVHSRRRRITLRRLNGVHRVTTTALFAEIAALAGDPARVGMLHALMDSRALTATELAKVAGITPQTASGHLSRMTAIGLLSVEKQGRHRYHRLEVPRESRNRQMPYVMIRPDQ